MKMSQEQYKDRFNKEVNKLWDSIIRDTKEEHRNITKQMGKHIFDAWVMKFYLAISVGMMPIMLNQYLGGEDESSNDNNRKSQDEGK